MAFFDTLTTSLKQKWLQFFQANRSWITQQMEVQSISTPDNGRRPSSYLILGVITALEPEIAQLMVPFTRLNPDVDALIDVLELNFDPDLFLGNRFNSPPSDDSNMLLDETADTVILVETGDESMVVMSPATFGDMSLDEIEESDDTTFETQSAAQPDVLDERKLADSNQANNPTLSEEEKQSKDDEISRLFPNF